VVAATVIAAVLIFAQWQDPTPAPPVSRSPQTGPSLAATDRLALDTQDCLKSTQTLEDLSQAVVAAGGAKGAAVIAAADRAETRMDRRLSTRNEQLHAVFADLKDSVAQLREAARTGRDGTAAIDHVLQLIDTLDARCQTALVPTGSATAPNG